MSAPLDPHDVLGLTPDASLAEVRRAYRQLIRKVHPDTSDLPEAIARERFYKITEAYRAILRAWRVDGSGRAARLAGALSPAEFARHEAAWLATPEPASAHSTRATMRPTGPWADEPALVRQYALPTRNEPWSFALWCVLGLALSYVAIMVTGRWLLPDRSGQSVTAGEIALLLAVAEGVLAAVLALAYVLIVHSRRVVRWMLQLRVLGRLALPARTRKHLPR